MGYRKQVKKIVRHTPVIKDYVARKDILEETIAGHDNQVSLLRQDIHNLQKRNDEWADEVRKLRHDDQRLNILWPVFEEDIIKADWRTIHKLPPYKSHLGPYNLNWVMPPMGPVSGGHADIFRIIHYLESKGHICRIYFYEALGSHSLDEIRVIMKNYPKVKAKLFYNAKKMEDCDAIFATNWFSAYPVYNFKGSAKKFYFVQDFEPYFEPVGTYSTLAENTYKFGFHGITLGKWLSDKLSAEYGMKTNYIELGTDLDDYHMTNRKKRTKILFYARPVTPRRGFELGSLALQIFHKQHPEYEINCLGWDLSRYNMPFPYVNNGILNSKELNELYNQCVTGLVLSFTNMSLLPLEMLSSGCIPVVNNAVHTRMATYADQLKLAEPTPRALAEALHEVVLNHDQATIAHSMANLTKGLTWENSNAEFERILTKELAS